MYIFCKIYGHFRLFVCLFIQCLLSLTFSSLVSEYALLCAALRCLCESVVRTRCSHCVVCLCLFYMPCSLCVYNAPSCHIENSVIFITTTVCPVALSVCSLQPRLARAILSSWDAVCGARVANLQRCGWLRFSLNHLLHCVGQNSACATSATCAACATVGRMSTDLSTVYPMWKQCPWILRFPLFTITCSRPHTW